MKEARNVNIATKIMKLRSKLWCIGPKETNYLIDLKVCSYAQKAWREASRAHYNFDIVKG